MSQDDLQSIKIHVCICAPYVRLMSQRGGESGGGEAALLGRSSAVGSVGLHTGAISLVESAAVTNGVTKLTERKVSRELNSFSINK